MRILMVGDVFGSAGRNVVATRLPELQERLKIDFTIANGENATHGAGITPAHAERLLNSGIDVITLGNHAFDERQILLHLERETRIIRPLNIARNPPGAGHRVFEAPEGQTILVVNALGQRNMEPAFGNPFAVVDDVLEAHPLGRAVSATVVDFHAEVTSEKCAMGAWCDGRASLVVGTHTHIPTADARILPHGTAYMTDVGMCGCYDSVIGMDKPEIIRRFASGLRSERPHPSTGDPSLCAIFVETDDGSGLATRVAPVCVGGFLEERIPALD